MVVLAVIYGLAGSRLEPSIGLDFADWPWRAHVTGRAAGAMAPDAATTPATSTSTRSRG
jgi:hypothetical protein